MRLIELELLKRKIRQIEKINNRKEISWTLDQPIKIKLITNYQQHNWKLYKHKHLSNQLKTLKHYTTCDCVNRIKDQLIIYAIKFLFINTSHSFTLCVFVSDLQQCDINATVLDQYNC
jgi:hypothetical protein